MLPIKKIYIDTRHRTADSKSTSDFKISLPNNITLPSNTAFYITDITVPVSWYTVEAGRNDTIYFRINSTNYAPSKCTLPEGNYSTITLGAAMCKAMNDNYPFTGAPGTTPTRFVPTVNLANNTIVLSNANDTFEIFTDEQVVALMYMGLYTAKVPTCSVNDMLQNTVKQIIKADGATQVVTNAVLPKFWTSGYVNLHPIRNLYLISNTLGTYNSMAVNGEWGILKKIPVSADYNQLIYDQTVLGMDYLDCSNQTLNLIDFKLKDHKGKIVNLHGGHVSFSIIFVKVADE